MRLARFITLCAIFTGSALAIQPAFADPAKATSAFYKYLYDQGFEVERDKIDNIAKETLVKGVYKLVNKNSGEFISFIAENGKICGDANGWKYAGSNRRLSNEEKFRLKVEILHSIKLQNFIRVQYGDGGGRKLILKSSLDCPYCKKMEANIAKSANTLNTTFYVLPSALDERYDSKVWDDVVKIWCADEGAAAWKTYWISMRAPASANCGLNSKLAREVTKDFREIMSSIGVRASGSPAIIREDGRVTTPPVELNSTQAEVLFGHEALKEVNEVYKMEKIPFTFLAE